MRFTPQFLDELRARLPVSEVVGRRVKLRKAGREWKGLSPFNKEKTPSFFVNDQKAMWFDFSAGKNGNIFDFVMLTEGVSFPEAVERLAEQAGMPLPKYSEADAKRDERRKTLIDIVELAAKFFEAALASRAGARARGYLADRGIDAATQLKFRLGYAPAERFALKEHLGKEGVPTADGPMRCCDGDEAGRRAAYRAVDLALPLLAPGKSLKFVSLPEGHDPDDLVRAGGREAVEEIIGVARPLAHVLWTRETEAGGL